MASMAILERKCDGCGACKEACPFGAIEIENSRAQMNAACRVCGMCQKACPKGAILRLETRAKRVNKQEWNGILVFCETTGGRAHPVSLELIGKAREMAGDVRAVVLGGDIKACANELLHYGVSRVYAYEDAALSFFRADAFADCAADAIRQMKPAAVLVGATALGRSLAPRLATRFRTGLTADCTRLEMRENTDLVQIRPAFGGNIMAQIITAHTRPQMATVRYKVMDAPQRAYAPSGEIQMCKLPKIASPVRFISASPVPAAANISDAQVIVAAGRALKRESDLAMIKELASLLGGEWATSRPLVEKGWNTNQRQIGLSGRTVKPRLIITCGISGAIQFAACMKAADHIIAINQDENAPIFHVAHVGIVGDVYDIVPRLIQMAKEARGV